MVWTMAAGFSAATANRHRATLCAIWRFARRKRWIATEPLDVDKIRIKKRVPDAWSIDQLGRILEACAAQQGRVCGIPASRWWVAFVLNLYDTGLRVGAALAARTEHLDPASGFLFVPAEAQKQKSDQVFHLHPQTLAAIAETRPADRDLLFPCSYNRHGLLDAYREILRQAGLPCDRRSLFHKLRRTSATFVADALGEEAAMKHLDHSCMAVTKAYLDPTKIRRTVRASDVLPRPDWKGGVR
jgi:integrase